MNTWTNSDVEALLNSFCDTNGHVMVGMGSVDTRTVKEEHVMKVHLPQIHAAYGGTKDNAGRLALMKTALSIVASQDMSKVPQDDRHALKAAWYIALIYGWLTVDVDKVQNHFTLAKAPGIDLGGTQASTAMPARGEKWMAVETARAMSLLVVAAKVTFRGTNHHLGVKDESGQWTGWLSKVLPLVRDQLCLNHYRASLTDDGLRSFIHSITHIFDSRAVLATIYDQSKVTTKIHHGLVAPNGGPPVCPLFTPHCLEQIQKRTAGLGSGCRGVSAAVAICGILVPSGVLYAAPASVQNAVVELLEIYSRMRADPWSYGEQSTYLIGKPCTDTWSAHLDLAGPYLARFIHVARASSTLKGTGLYRRYKGGEVSPMYAKAVQHLASSELSLKVDEKDITEMMKAFGATGTISASARMASAMAGAGLITDEEKTKMEAKIAAHFVGGAFQP